ncbi:LysR substrate-binding domain-containing protein, partial [Enterobacter hormaechei]
YYLRGQEPPRWHFHKVTGGEETVMVKGQGNFATNNSESVRDAALQGLGIALLPDFSARAALAAGTLTQVLPAWRTVDAFAESLWVIRPHTAQVPK